MSQFRVGDTNILVSKNAKICINPNTHAKIRVTHEQVEYRWHWVPNARGWHWACTFHVVCVNFVSVG